MLVCIPSESKLVLLLVAYCALAFLQLIAVVPPSGKALVPYPLAENFFDHVVEVDVRKTASHKSPSVQILQLRECFVPRTVTELGARTILTLTFAVAASKDWEILSSTEAESSSLPQWHEASKPIPDRVPLPGRLLRNWMPQFGKALIDWLPQPISSGFEIC